MLKNLNNQIIKILASETVHYLINRPGFFETLYVLKMSNKWQVFPVKLVTEVIKYYKRCFAYSYKMLQEFVYSYKVQKPGCVYS